MEFIEQLGMLLGDRVLGLPSNQGTVFRCGLEYLENDLSGQCCILKFDGLSSLYSLPFLVHLGPLGLGSLLIDQPN